MSKRPQMWMGLVLICVCSVMCVSARAQAPSTAVVRGRVVDAAGAPVIRIKVTLGTLWGYSDATGRYLFSRVPFGTYRLTLERNGRKVVAKDSLDIRRPVTDVPDLKWQ